MKYPNFAMALRSHGKPAEIIQKFGFKRRMVFYYLAGLALPRAEKIAKHPDLIEAIRRDVSTPSQIAA